MDRLQSFLWWCAGVNTEIIKKTPSEASKYFGIGGTVFFTGIFAALAGGYALHTIFDSIYIAIGFGILWGLMIFNLDRYIVSSMRKKSSRLSEFWMALPRIILAIIISIVIARPLELKIFEKEIESELVVMHQEDIKRKELLVKNRFAPENATLNAEIKALEEEITMKEQKRDELMRIAQAEADGTGGSQRRNAGPIYKIKKADADRADNELRELKTRNLSLINEKLESLDENDSLSHAQLQSMEIALQDGLASRLEAMDRIATKSEAIKIAHIFILLLFIAVETAPIIVKLIASRGPYDYLQQKEDYTFESEYYMDIAYINTKARNHTDGFATPESEFVEKKLNMGLEKS